MADAEASQEGATYFPLATCYIRCTPGTRGAANNITPAFCLNAGRLSICRADEVSPDWSVND
jgi:hypothetical protein